MFAICIHSLKIVHIHCWRHGADRGRDIKINDFVSNLLTYFTGITSDCAACLPVAHLVNVDLLLTIFLYVVNSLADVANIVLNIILCFVAFFVMIVRQGCWSWMLLSKLIGVGVRSSFKHLNPFFSFGAFWFQVPTGSEKKKVVIFINLVRFIIRPFT